MRHMVLLATAVAAAVCLGVRPAAAQKKGPVAPVAPGRAAAPGTKAAPATVPAPPINLDRLATTAGLDAATKSRVAPHVAEMNRQLVQMRQATGRVRKDAPQAEKDRAHKELADDYAGFKQHWDAARALVPSGKQAQFDAAVRAEMGARPVGNPHQTLPATHPKLNPHGGKLTK